MARRHQPQPLVWQMAVYALLCVAFENLNANAAAAQRRQPPPLAKPACPSLSLSSPATTPPTPYGRPRLSPLAAGTAKVRVRTPRKLRNGATLGDIPIGYAHWNKSRNGHYYLPKGYQNRRLPVFLMLHGAGSDGYYIINHYSEFADKYRFIIIAPDSRARCWNHPNMASDPFTDDMHHVLACYSYVEKLGKVLFDRKRIAVGGNSAGGYLAGAVATRTKLATHAICTHSQFFWQQMGGHVVPIWFSTGTRDPLFPFAYMKRYLSGQFHRHKPKLKYTLHVFVGGHSVGHADELAATINWWLDTPGGLSSG